MEPSLAEVHGYSGEVEMRGLRWITYLLISILLVPIIGCGSGSSIIRPGDPIELGPVVAVVNRITLVKDITGTSVNGGAETVSPERGAFLVVEWTARNKADKPIMVRDPIAGTSSIKIIGSQMPELSRLFLTDIEDQIVFGADLAAGQSESGLFAVFDVPETADLYLVFSDGYEASVVSEAFRPREHRLKVQEVKRLGTAVLGKAGFTYH